MSSYQDSRKLELVQHEMGSAVFMLGKILKNIGVATCWNWTSQSHARMRDNDCSGVAKMVHLLTWDLRSTCEK